jgi:double-strand break repair protein AddB
MSRIYTVPAGRPFLTALAEALVAGDLPVPGRARTDPLALADVTLLLPTRRATRALQEAFLKAAGGTAVLLPRIRPIIGAAEEGGGVLSSAEDLATDSAGALKPAISDFARQLALAKLISAWADAEKRPGSGEGDLAPYSGAAAHTPAQAVRLARELAALMDAMEIEDVDPARIGALVPESFAEHWGRTLAFLRIVTEHWPAFLEERGLTSKMAHARALVLEQARQLRAEPAAAPIIVAGVMSSAPAVTELVRAVVGSPNGALVLPGLDQRLDAASWDAILPAHPEHPQYGMCKLLAALGVAREDVALLPGPAPTRAERARAVLASEAMRPARTTECWHQFAASAQRDGVAEALAGLAVLEAPTGEDEAEAIALILREVAEAPGRTAALVSPDRRLARRVAARLAAWDINVEDSAGQPLAKTPIGAFLDLVIEAVATGFAPLALMALLKHPFCRLGRTVDELRRGRSALELAAFRAPYFGQGLEGVAAALERAENDLAARKRRHRAVHRLAHADWQAARAVVRALRRALRKLEALFAADAGAGLQALAEAHCAAASAVAASPADPSAASIWQGGAGEEAAKLLAALCDRASEAPVMPAADYPEFYRSLVAEVTVRRRAATHPRIAILEPYESRLQQPDVVIIGSLNEGVWPQAADPGPWLNRPMRKALGMPAPEERIGDAAHIFTSLLGADQVYLTRAAKIDGVPTVPSRWLLRLQTLLNALPLSPRGREREAITYGCVAHPGHAENLDGAAANHLAELARGDCPHGEEGPLIRPIVAEARLRHDGAPSPQREKGRSRPPRENLDDPGAPVPWLSWARARNALAGPPRPVKAPEPRPALALRPRQLSVTTIERWIANPYAVFAQRILELDPLPGLGCPPDAALRGQIVHEALGRFAERFPDRLPPDIGAELIALARAGLEALTGAPRVAAFWTPRFARFAAWFAETEPGRRAGMARTVGEVEGAIVLAGPAGPFTLKARADRVDIGADGIVITDYKTGANLRELASKAVQGEAPQLPLEAAIALGGGFTGLAAPTVRSLRYVSAAGGEPPGQDCPLKDDPATLARAAHEGLARLIAAFDDEATPYRALRRARFNYRYDDYAHLARVAEWSAVQAEEA